MTAVSPSAPPLAARDQAYEVYRIAPTAAMSWSAVVAGAVLAAALSALLLTLAAGLGLTVAGIGAAAPDAEAAGWTAAAVLIGVHVAAFGSAGYVAARLRVVAAEKSLADVRARDAAHGLLAWALGLVTSAAVASLLAFGVVDPAARTAGAALSAVAEAASGAGDAATDPSADASAYLVDTLFRPADAAGAPPGATPSPLEQASRILARYAGSGAIEDADRAYLADLVSRRTGATPDQARTRVDAAIATIDAAARETREAAETAARAAALGALLAVAAAIAGLAAAMSAALLGGARRDEPFA